MAIPSGSGTEVLKVGLNTSTSTTENLLINGVSNHIYTVLSVVVCETAGNSETFDLYVKDDAGTVFYLIKEQVLAPKKTFVFNDRIVLAGTDELLIAAGGTCDINITTSYIDQDWT